MWRFAAVDPAVNQDGICVGAISKRVSVCMACLGTSKGVYRPPSSGNPLALGSSYTTLQEYETRREQTELAKDLRKDRRTGVELIREWIEEKGGLAEAARLLGWDSNRLWNFIHRKRSVANARYKSLIEFSRETGIPLEVVLCRDRPACEVLTTGS
jgi:hypothetical protein